MFELKLPFLIFHTQKMMHYRPENPYYCSPFNSICHADDMRFGDISETTLREKFGLRDVSSTTHIRQAAYYQSRSFHSRTSFEPAGYIMEQSRRDRARPLFAEMRRLARAFSFYGPNWELIYILIDRFQENRPGIFTDPRLDAALHQQIMDDVKKDPDNSSLVAVKKALSGNIDWEKQYFPQNKVAEISGSIQSTILPKFTGKNNYFNGLGISVHDIHAAHITLQSLHIEGNRWWGKVHYKIQDHFGLDVNDIRKWPFRHFRFFHIWFVLQRSEEFGFRPFVTQMEATFDIEGEIIK